MTYLVGWPQEVALKYDTAIVRLYDYLKSCTGTMAVAVDYIVTGRVKERGGSTPSLGLFKEQGKRGAMLKR